MSKFGELLDEKKPLLIVFFSEFDELSTSMHPVLKDVAAAIGDKGKVIKINSKYWKFNNGYYKGRKSTYLDTYSEKFRKEFKNYRRKPNEKIN